MKTIEHMNIANSTLLQLAERPRVHVPAANETEVAALRAALHAAAAEDEVSLRINTVDGGLDVALRRAN